MSFVLPPEHKKWFKEEYNIEIESIPSTGKLQWDKKKNKFLKETFGDDPNFEWIKET